MSKRYSGTLRHCSDASCGNLEAGFDDPKIDPFVEGEGLLGEVRRAKSGRGWKEEGKVKQRGRAFWGLGGRQVQGRQGRLGGEPEATSHAWHAQTLGKPTKTSETTPNGQARGPETGWAKAWLRELVRASHQRFSGTHRWSTHCYRNLVISPCNVPATAAKHFTLGTVPPHYWQNILYNGPTLRDREGCKSVQYNREQLLQAPEDSPTCPAH
ncbi:hypothetical protein V8F33_002770 [Rhypophila sp. PSN 637]